MDYTDLNNPLNSNIKIKIFLRENTIYYAADSIEVNSGTFG
jgi:hypothetical protein